jgi:hypothetical protein
MMRQRMRPVAITEVLVVVLAGISLLVACDRSPTAPSTSFHDDTAVARHAQIESLAQALANRVTHICVDGRNNLYWTQESDAAGAGESGRDVLFMLPDAAAPASGVGTVASELPRATQLTSTNILKAIEGSRGVSGKGRSGGAIQSIVAGPDGEIYFYFVGGIGKVTRACLGRFDPRGGPGTESIRILADTKQLADATGMGGSLELARATLVVQKPDDTPASSRVVLFLHHTDSRAIFAFEPRRLRNATLSLAMSKPQGLSEIRRADTGEVLDLTRDDFELAAGTGEDLLLADRRLGALYRVDPLGKATLLVSLVGLPEGISTPTAVSDDLFADATSRVSSATTLPTGGGGGCVLMFAPEGNPIDPPISSRPDPANVQLRPPALLSFSPGNNSWVSLDGGDLRAPGGFATHTLRLQQLVPIDPGPWARDPNANLRTRAAFVGYDSASGLLIRLRLVERR